MLCVIKLMNLCYCVQPMNRVSKRNLPPPFGNQLFMPPPLFCCLALPRVSLYLPQVSIRCLVICMFRFKCTCCQVEYVYARRQCTNEAFANRMTKRITDNSLAAIARLLTAQQNMITSQVFIAIVSVIVDFKRILLGYRAIQKSDRVLMSRTALCQMLHVQIETHG